ncbi:MAG: ScpA family protein [Actinomycetota bacterium]
MTYAVETEVFEGPFDLLLHLILAEEVDLYEVNLCDIVDAYLLELERMEACDLDVATEFLLIAATLVELKSRRLLPELVDPDLDEELALWEERDLLLSRLLECKTFKDASAVLARLADDGARVFPRTAGLEEQFVGLAPDLLEAVGPTDLRDAMVAVVNRPRPRLDLDHVAPIRVSVTDAIDELVAELPDLGTVRFSEITSSLVDRLDVIVRFLAVLELFKSGWVELDQPTTFGELTIAWTGAGDEDDAELVAVDVYDG